MSDNMIDKQETGVMPILDLDRIDNETNIDYDEMIKKYNPETLKYGYNTLEDGEEIYYIPNPALGLWVNKEKF